MQGVAKVNRQTRFFLIVLLVEAVVFAGFYFVKSSQPRPPQFSTAGVDPFTEADLTEKVSQCRSAEDFKSAAEAFMATGFFPEAVASFARAVELAPESAELAYKNGFCLSRIGKLQESNKELQRAIDLNFENASAAMYFIGRNHLRAEEPDKAEAAFRKASKLPVGKFELAKILYRKNELEEARQLLGEVSEAEPRRARVANLLSRIYLAEGDKSSAYLTGLDASTYWLRLSTPFKTENDAMKQIAGSFGIGEKDITSQMQIGQHQFDEARRTLKSIQEHEWSPAAQDSLLKIASRTSRLIDARDVVKERFERAGPSSGILLMLGNLEDVNGNRDEAVKCWELGFQLNTDKASVECAEQLGQHYYGLRENERADEYAFYFEASKINEAARRDNYLRAEAVAKAMVKANPTIAEGYYLYARAAVGMFNRKAAIRSLKRCVQLDPTHGRAKQMLEALQNVSVN